MSRQRKYKTVLLFIILLVKILSIHFSVAFTDHSIDLYEGKSCIMENGNAGECIELPKCPYRIRQVQDGKRFSTSSGRCTFEKFIEIVCCPLSEINSRNVISTTTLKPVQNNNEGINNLFSKLDLRPADVACHKYENKVIGDEDEKINTNILNGERALTGEFPYMVALGYITTENDPSHIKYNCGGTLLSIHYVLTAAHCVSNIDNFVPVEVKLGALNLSDNSNYVQRVSITEIFTHPNYRRSKNYHDIAVMKLMKPAIITKNVMPICLQTKPIPNMATLVNMSLVVTGWGATIFENENESSAILKKTPNLKIVDLIECHAKYKRSARLPNGLDNSMICMLDINMTRRADSCQGDSGGPLLLLSRVSSIVVGVTSFGQSCGSSVPAIYTSVVHYLDWIEKIVWPTQTQIQVQP